MQINHNFNRNVYSFFDSAINEFLLDMCKAGKPFAHANFYASIKEDMTYKEVVEFASQYGTCKVFQSSGPSSYLVIYESRSIMALATWKAPNIEIYGDPELIDILQKKYKTERSQFSEISWWYMVQGKLHNKVFVPKAKETCNEFYPFIKDGIENFIDRYLASSASILLLIGPPGTGKTSFIRHLLCSRHRKTFATFDEDVMCSDEYFANFIESDYYNLMVVEDADVLLSSRQKHGNKVMTKFLNASDGLIPLEHKKLIFSTNLDNINNIDPALIRPGRCFEVLQFRQLSYPETTKLCEAKGLTKLADRNREYTLSEIFMGDVNKPTETNEGKGFGFL